MTWQTNDQAPMTKGEERIPETEFRKKSECRTPNLERIPQFTFSNQLPAIGNLCGAGDEWPFGIGSRSSGFFRLSVFGI